MDTPLVAAPPPRTGRAPLLAAGLVGAGLLGAAFVMTRRGEELSTKPVENERVFLHIADLHADPFYDYRHFFEPQMQLSRDPKLYSNHEPAAECGIETVEGILEHWNRTGGGARCPCGQYGSNPPYAVLDELRKEIERQQPEFIVWSGDFASHFEPGTAQGDPCQTAKASAKASMVMVDAKGTPERPIQHLFVLGNNDVLPKRQPITWEWLIEWGQHMLSIGWLLPAEVGTWNLGGFYRRNVGDGLCVIGLNSNSWTAHQCDEEMHQNQLRWFNETAFSEDPTCVQYLVNAHVPLGWLGNGWGHHNWTNLDGVALEHHSDAYRRILEEHSAEVIAELYGHINKADIRLMPASRQDVEDDSSEDALGDLGENIGDTDDDGEVEDDVDTNPNDEEVKDGNDLGIISFTVAGISRRAKNDPQFQRVTLKNLKEDSDDFVISDIDVFSMRCGCDFTFAYSFRDLFHPHFDDAIDEVSLKGFVEDQAMLKRVESHLSMTDAPYEAKDLKNTTWVEEVREGRLGCACKSDPSSYP